MEDITTSMAENIGFYLTGVFFVFGCLIYITERSTNTLTNEYVRTRIEELRSEIYRLEDVVDTKFENIDEIDTFLLSKFRRTRRVKELESLIDSRPPT